MSDLFYLFQKIKLKELLFVKDNSTFLVFENI